MSQPLRRGAATAPTTYDLKFVGESFKMHPKFSIQFRSEGTQALLSALLAAAGLDRGSPPRSVTVVATFERTTRLPEFRIAPAAHSNHSVELRLKPEGHDRGYLTHVYVRPGESVDEVFRKLQAGIDILSAEEEQSVVKFPTPETPPEEDFTPPPFGPDEAPAEPDVAPSDEAAAGSFDEESALALDNAATMLAEVAKTIGEARAEDRTLAAERAQLVGRIDEIDRARRAVSGRIRTAARRMDLDTLGAAAASLQ